MSDINAVIRQALAPFKQEIMRLRQEMDVLREAAKKPRTVQEEIDAIPGRRLFYSLVGTVLFDATADGRQGNPVTMLVSQDGPFIMTHYPVIMWKPTLPSNATNFGIWRPIAATPLPVETITADTINISYQFIDTGSQRNFQSSPVPPGLISSADNVIPLPVPSLFTPNTTIQVIPTYEDINFNGSTAPTQGQLVVALPGYRIVNM